MGLMAAVAVLLVAMLLMLVPGEGFTCVVSNSCTSGGGRVSKPTSTSR